MEKLEHRFNVRMRAQFGRDEEARVAPSLATGGRTCIRQPVALPRRGKWPISYSLARLADTVFGFTCMKIVAKQFEVSPRSVPRGRCVRGRGRSPSQESPEEGNRR